VLAGIVPGGVEVVETDGDLMGPLFAEEEALLARAVEKRRREFTTGRHCARAALGKLGVGPVAILRGEKGEPLWPAGIVGSLTHCAGYRAAAVARAEDVVTVGIDAEPHEPLPDGILDQIAGAAEVAHLAELGGGCDWDRLLFCAKEATYKAWFPLARRWLGFHDAEVTIDPDARTFRSRMLVPGPVDGFSGRYLATPAHLLAAIVIPAGE
jgi:4'-phosphopantetheinyl transferase EntD